MSQANVLAEIVTALEAVATALPGFRWGGVRQGNYKSFPAMGAVPFWVVEPPQPAAPQSETMGASGWEISRYRVRLNCILGPPELTPDLAIARQAGINEQVRVAFVTDHTLNATCFTSRLLAARSNLEDNAYLQAGEPPRLQWDLEIEEWAARNATA